MKLIKAYIRHRKTEDVYNALNKAGFGSMTFVDCEGTGQYVDHEREHISDKYPFAEAYKVVKLEILISGEHVEKVVDIVREYGRTGYSGDGMVMVLPVDEVYKVRNKETGILSI